MANNFFENNEALPKLFGVLFMAGNEAGMNPLHIGTTQVSALEIDILQKQKNTSF